MIICRRLTIPRYLILLITFFLVFPYQSYADNLVKVDPQLLGIAVDIYAIDPTNATPGLGDKGFIVSAASDALDTTSADSIITTAAYTNIIGLLRWPAGNKYTGWMSMQENKGYFRDAFSAIRHLASASQDGDYWDVKLIIQPTEKGKSQEQYYWNRLTYYAQIGDYTDCFYTPGWSYAICGSKSIYMTSYINSQCMTFGYWTMYVYENGTEVGNRQFAMLPEVPPEDISYASQSSPDRYDGICYKTGYKAKTYPCDPYVTPPTGMEYFTIGQKGCALTSTAMVMSYIESISSNSPALVYKEPLNTYLTTLSQQDPKNSDGYNKYGGIIWSGPASYSDKVNFLQLSSNANNQFVRDKVCGRGPQVMAVKPKTLKDGRVIPGHFVTVIGRDINDTTWQIYDPNPSKGITTLQAYNNVYLGSRLFSGKSVTYNDPLNRATFNIYSPADLLVTDPFGRKTGYDPITGIEYNQIPGSGYQGESLDDDETDEPSEDHWFVLDIAGPAEGKYTIQVTGTDTGTYDLEVRTINVDGQPAPMTALNDVATEPDKIHKFAFEYSATSSTPPVLVPIPVDDPPPPPTDLTPPTVSLALSPEIIWPPRHRMVEIIADLVVSDDTDPDPIVKLESVSCNECTDLTEDVVDAETGTDDRLFYVRGDRSGSSLDGRHYTVVYSATDSAGNKTTVQSIVTVPHDQRDK